MTFLASEFFEIPGSLFMALFFVAVIPSMTPYWRKRAPFGYWGLVCAAWMGAAVVGVLLLTIVRLVMGVPIDGKGEPATPERQIRIESNPQRDPHPPARVVPVAARPSGRGHGRHAPQPRPWRSRRHMV